MKRKLWIMLALTVLLALLCFGAAMAEVTTGQCGDNVTWLFDSATGVVTVTGTDAELLPLKRHQYFSV